MLLVFCLLFIVTGHDGVSAEQKKEPDLQEMLGGFMQGMQAALKELQKPPAGAGGEAANDGDQPDQLAGLKSLVDSIDPEQIGNFFKNPGQLGDLFKNMMSPEKLMEGLPENFKGLLPPAWRAKLAEILMSETDAIRQLWEKLAAHKSGDDLWKTMREDTPKLAELLEDVWNTMVQRWAQFEEPLQPEAKEYVGKVKSSFGHWLSEHVLGSFGPLSYAAKVDLHQSLVKAVPMLEPLLTKAVQSEALGKWAEQLGKSSTAEEEGVKEQAEQDADKEEL